MNAFRTNITTTFPFGIHATAPLSAGASGFLVLILCVRFFGLPPTGSVFEFLVHSWDTKNKHVGAYPSDSTVLGGIRELNLSEAGNDPRHVTIKRNTKWTVGN